LFFNGMVVRIR